MHNFYRLTLAISILLISFFAAAMPALIVDGDGDGISDEYDDCPYSAPDSVVTSNGCTEGSQDSDGDGVEDSQDDCPYSPPGAWIDSSGCALDADFDGVADGLDLCVRTELKAKVDPRGCAAGQSPVAVSSVGSKIGAVEKTKPTISKTPPQAPLNKKPVPVSKTVKKKAPEAVTAEQGSVRPEQIPDTGEAKTVPTIPTEKRVLPTTEVSAVVSDKTESGEQSSKAGAIRQPETLSDLIEAPATKPVQAVSSAVQVDKAEPKKTVDRVLTQPQADGAQDWQKEPLFRTLFFAANSSEITAFSMEKISRALPALIARRNSHPKLRIEVIGHADVSESEQDVLAISQERARLVAAYLSAQGIPRNAIHVSAKGAEIPRATGGDGSVNRRVEILTYAE